MEAYPVPISPCRSCRTGSRTRRQRGTKPIAACLVRLLRHNANRAVPLIEATHTRCNLMRRMQF